MLEQKDSWMEKVEQLAAQVASEQGCVLYDLEFEGLGKGRTLRVYIDKDPAVGIDECSNVSHGLNELLDSNDVVPGGEYNLEVSTPGVDRRLTKPWHYEKVVGKKIWFKTKDAFETYGVTSPSLMKSKQLESVLLGTNSGKLIFKNKDGEFQIPIEGIQKAHVVFEMTKGQKK